MQATDDYTIEYSVLLKRTLYNALRVYFPDMNPNNVFIFNGGILHVVDNVYLMTARVIIPNCGKWMNHAELPTMWAPIDGVKECSGWGNELDQGMVVMLEIENFNEFPNILALQVLRTQHSNEDPRLYFKADGFPYVCTTTTHGGPIPCDLLQVPVCSYMSEFRINITKSQNKYQLSLDLVKHPVCPNVVIQTPPHNGHVIVKNLSHWTLDGVDYYTDYSTAYAPYTIYAQTPNGTCEKVKVANETTCFKEISNCFKLTYSYINPDLTMQKFTLLNFNGTTPSVRVPDYMMQQYFPNENGPLFCGVAHLRMQTQTIVSGENAYPSTQAFLRSKGENNLYTDVADFLADIHTRTQSGNLYQTQFPETYVMMLYFFRGDTDENDNRGKIVYTSDIFYPLPVTRSGSIDSHFVLVFPVGLLFHRGKVVISYGEGDIRLYVMHVSMETLGLHKVECGKPTMRMKTLLLPCLGKDRETTNATVDTLIHTQFIKT